jgi:anti-anti-sigma regulatory factor
VWCLYTDGLVEQRDQPIDEGIGQLCAAVTAADPEASCAAVMTAMADVSPHSDDVALFTVRRHSGIPGGGADSSGYANAVTAQEGEVRWSGPHAVVTMPAAIDVTNSSVMSDLLAAVADEFPEVITADLTATTFCDSAGFTHSCASIGWSRQRRQMRLAIGDSPAVRIIQFTGLNQIMRICSDVQQSLAAL